MKTTFLAIAMILSMSSAVMAQDMSTNSPAVVIESASEFKVIEISELPALVKSSFDTDFPNATIKEVQSNGAVFKFFFTSATGEEQMVQYSADGEKVQ